MFAAWINLKTFALGDQRGLRVRDLIDEAGHDPDLMEALVEVAEGQGNLAGKIDHSRMTRWLARNENTIAGGLGARAKCTPAPAGRRTLDRAAALGRINF